MSEKTALTDPTDGVPQTNGTAETSHVPTQSGFSPTEVETICQILYRIATRMQEKDSEALPETTAMPSRLMCKDDQ